jgi:hypothetical protein
MSKDSGQETLMPQPLDAHQGGSGPRITVIPAVFYGHGPYHPHHVLGLGPTHARHVELTRIADGRYRATVIIMHGDMHIPYHFEQIEVPQDGISPLWRRVFMEPGTDVFVPAIHEPCYRIDGLSNEQFK